MSPAPTPGPVGRVAFVGGVRDAAAALDVLPRSSAVLVGVVAHEDASARRAGLAVLTSRARALGVPVLTPRGATSHTAVEWLRNLALDFLVCVGWSSLLTQEMLMVPRHGTVGLKQTLMPPEQRRVAVDWAALRGETLTGHPMLVLAPDATSDAPERPVPAVPSDRAADNRHGTYDDLARVGTQMLETELAEIALGQVRGRRGGGSEATLEPVPALGLTSFDRSATDVYRWIRALGHPRSGAFSHLRGERVVLWSCERVGEHDSRLPAGTLLGVDGDGVVVTTRAGGVRLLEVQGEGRPPEPAAEWFHRRELPPGCAFEPVDWDSLAWVLPRS